MGDRVIRHKFQKLEDALGETEEIGNTGGTKVTRETGETRETELVGLTELTEQKVFNPITDPPTPRDANGSKKLTKYTLR